MTSVWVSFVSVVLGGAASLFSLFLTWRERSYAMNHTDRHNELLHIADVATKCIAVYSPDTLHVYMRRAAAVEIEEKTEDFLTLTEKHIYEIELCAAEVMSIKEITKETAD